MVTQMEGGVVFRGIATWGGRSALLSPLMSSENFASKGLGSLVEGVAAAMVTGVASVGGEENQK